MVKRNADWLNWQLTYPRSWHIDEWITWIHTCYAYKVQFSSGIYPASDLIFQCTHEPSGEGVHWRHTHNMYKVYIKKLWYQFWETAQGRCTRVGGQFPRNIHWSESLKLKSDWCLQRRCPRVVCLGISLVFDPTEPLRLSIIMTTTFQRWFSVNRFLL